MLDKYFDKVTDKVKDFIASKRKYKQLVPETTNIQLELVQEPFSAESTTLESVSLENPVPEVAPVPEIASVPEVAPVPQVSRKKAILLALFVGATICSYSIVDSKGVSKMNPIAYMCIIELISGILAAPYILWRHRPEAVKNLKKYIAFIGPASFASYIAILYAFQKANASYIVAMREVSVVIGSILGFIFLKEKFTLRKALGIVFIAVGLVLVKLA